MRDAWRRLLLLLLLLRSRERRQGCVRCDRAESQVVGQERVDVLEVDCQHLNVEPGLLHRPAEGRCVVGLLRQLCERGHPSLDVCCGLCRLHAISMMIHSTEKHKRATRASMACTSRVNACCTAATSVDDIRSCA